MSLDLQYRFSLYHWLRLITIALVLLLEINLYWELLLPRPLPARGQLRRALTWWSSELLTDWLRQPPPTSHLLRCLGLDIDFPPCLLFPPRPQRDSTASHSTLTAFSQRAQTSTGLELRWSFIYYCLWQAFISKTTFVCNLQRKGEFLRNIFINIYIVTFDNFLFWSNKLLLLFFKFL